MPTLAFCLKHCWILLKITRSISVIRSVVVIRSRHDAQDHRVTVYEKQFQSNINSEPGDRLSSLKCKWLFQLTSNNDSMLVFPKFIPFGSIQAQLPQSHIQPRGTRARHGATWHLLLEGRRVCCEQLWRRQPETNGQMFVTWGCRLQTFAISMQIKTQFLVQVDAVWLLTTSPFCQPSCGVFSANNTTPTDDLSC